MRNLTQLFYSVVLLLCVSSMISCSDVLEGGLIAEDTSATTTRGLGNFSDYYYWYKGEKIGVSSLRNLFYISSSDSLSLASAKFNSSLTSSIETQQDIQGATLLNRKKSYWKIIKIKPKRIMATASVINSIKAGMKSKDIHISPVFGTEQHIRPTSEYFYVKLKASQDYSVLQNTAKELAAEIVGEVPFVPDWYMLRAPTSSCGLETSNKFYETSKFEEVDPAFVFDFRTNSCNSEPDFGRQWGLDKINICSAWNITKGSPKVTVAVLDQGIDQGHQEFRSNFSSLSYDVINRSKPSVVYGNHGTHVGGIIGANLNNIQIAGVAPQSTLLSISHSLRVYPGVSGELASGIGYAQMNGADVINCSWGDYAGRYPELHSAILENAINSALINGRKGKGMIVVFAAGNRETYPDYPANTNPDILVVGAMDRYNRRAYFSSYGSPLDIVAPGVDILSTLPGNKVGSMDGTSMAAPHVSGVAALILSVNPELTRKEVVDIIEKTSQKVSGYSFSNNPNRKNGTWNGEMGYGVCDAFAAVSAAQGNTVYFENKRVTSQQSVTGWRIQAKNITVTRTGFLKFVFNKEVVIHAPFLVEKGGLLEITR